MKLNRFLSVMMLSVTMLTLSIIFKSCAKDVPAPSSVKIDHESFLQKTELATLESQQMYGDAPVDESLVFTEDEFLEICRLEDQYLNIWSNDDLKKCLPVGSKNTMDYHSKLLFLLEKIPSAQRTSEGETVETIILRSGKAPLFDSSPEIVAQTIAASGTIVGIHSSLNFWRPTFPADNGAVTSFDVTRSIIANASTSFLDTAVEYDPTSVEWAFEVSGGNWLIGATIVEYSPAGVPTYYQYGFDSPLGPLVWNPTLGSPASDDLIQGPLPGGVVAIAANGLTPPLPIE